MVDQVDNTDVQKDELQKAPILVKRRNEAVQADKQETPRRTRLPRTRGILSRLSGGRIGGKEEETSQHKQY